MLYVNSVAKHQRWQLGELMIKHKGCVQDDTGVFECLPDEALPRADGLWAGNTNAKVAHSRSCMISCTGGLS